jgi:glycogen operon protein
LGITAVELMPVHHHVDDRHLLEKKLTNYWGYNTLAFFAPDIRYAAGGTARESVHQFKMMVRGLHAAGLEVILDVVYNHTAEGNQLGPTLSMRGVDNVSYYRLSPEDKRYYMDFTGCGNTLNMVNPRVLQLIMDSLRHWVLEMHVDGFRFDLASTLARELHAVNKLGAFFDIIQQDPILSQVKLIAEPWDVGEGGYQVGNFPVLWTEWNGKYRDNVRRFWKGDGGTASEFATRLSGSSDLYEQGGRLPHASINFVTCHDGFTVQDLVSYNEKHNEANGEDNRDGSSDNLSNNCGHEGPTDDPTINALRRQLRKNQLACLMLAQGLPLILAGDEVGNTQNGNNNAYCQDDEIGWIGWENLGHEDDLTDFVGHLTELRRRFPQIRSRHWLDGRRADGSYGVLWLTPAAAEMTEQDWNFPEGRFLAYVLGPDEQGQAPIFIVLNAAPEAIAFRLPGMAEYKTWQQVLNTVTREQPATDFPSGSETEAPPRSVLAFAGSA